MKSKTAIALAAALSTFLLTAPAVSHADGEPDWFLQQLQITDGYAPVYSVQGQKDAAAFGLEGAGPTVIEDRTLSEWLAQQLQMTDGYAPPPVVRAKDEKGTMTSAYQGVGTTQN